MALKDERLYSIGELCRERDLPLRRGRETWRRYCRCGTESSGGSLVKLESLLIGGHYHTSKEAVNRFFERLQELCQ